MCYKLSVTYHLLLAMYLLSSFLNLLLLAPDLFPFACVIRFVIFTPIHMLWLKCIFDHFLNRPELVKCMNNCQIVPTPGTTQHNLNTVVGFDIKMTVQTPPHHPTTQTQHELHKPQNDIHWWQLNILWSATTSMATKTTTTTSKTKLSALGASD